MNEAHQSWLSEVLSARGATNGTVHVLGEDDVLVLTAAVAIPEPVVAITRRIPRGKGMAGLALERATPVQTCNLKTDETGDVRPGARAVDAQAAVALPVAGPDGTIHAVVGFAFAEARDLEDAEIAELAELAATLPVT